MLISRNITIDYLVCSTYSVSQEEVIWPDLDNDRFANDFWCDDVTPFTVLTDPEDSDDSADDLGSLTDENEDDRGGLGDDDVDGDGGHLVVGRSTKEGFL
jgi:hypothetical protein